MESIEDLELAAQRGNGLRINRALKEIDDVCEKEDLLERVYESDQSSHGSSYLRLGTVLNNFGTLRKTTLYTTDAGSNLLIPVVTLEDIPQKCD